jgi:hypothetical protein
MDKFNDILGTGIKLLPNLAMLTMQIIELLDKFMKVA